MDWASNSASSKKSGDVSGDIVCGVVIPIQKTTLKLLSVLFKEEGPKSASIEEALKMDPLLSGFMDYNFDRGTELLEDHYAMFRGSLDKFTRNKRQKIGVGEDTNFMLDLSEDRKGKTKVDETTTVGMLQEPDEATDFGNDQTDNEMDDDKADVAETDEDMDKEAVYQHDRRVEHFRVCRLKKDKSEDVPDTRSLFEKVMADPFIGFLAERISNNEDLIDISNKFLENLRKDDVSIAQHKKLVSQFWENKQFLKGLCEELYESLVLFQSMVNFARMVVEEEPHEKVDRIKKDPAVEKLFDEKDRVVKMRGILGILIGYCINKDMLIARGNELHASDAVPKRLKYYSQLWLHLR